MTKRLIAFFSVLALLLSCLPAGVLAEGTQEQSVQAQETINAPAPHSHSDLQHNCEHCDGAVEWTAWGDDAAEKTAMPSASGHYYLVSDIQIANTTDIKDSAELVLCLNGYTVDGGLKKYIYRVGTNGSATDKTKVTVSDCTAYTDEEGQYHAGAMIRGTGKDGGGAFFMRGASSLTMYAGILSGHQNTQTAADAGYGGGAIHARNTATVTLKNVHILDSSSQKDGGALCARDSVQVVLENVVFKNNSSQRDGGAIFLQSKNNKLTATDCVFEGNTATARGGAICAVEGSQVIITGGEFKNNTANTLGGAIYSNNSPLNITGTEAKPVLFTGNHGKNDSNGGAILCTGAAESYLRYLELTGNTAANNGASALMVTGGARVHLENSTVTGNENQKAGTFRGAVYVAGVASKLYLSGKTVIRNNNAQDLYIQNNNYNRTNDDCWLDASGLSEGADIRLFTHTAIEGDYLNSRILEGKPDAWKRGWIVYAANDMTVDFDKTAGTYFFTVNSTHLHCDCGDGLDSHCDHAENAYMDWTDATSLPTSGYYCLKTDVILTQNARISSGALHLCLNGHTITADYPEQGNTKDRIFTMSGTGALYLSDCTAREENGVYTAGKLTGSSYTAIMIANSSTSDNTVKIHFYDGIFTGNQSSAGAAFSIQDGATLYMYGGQISQNHSTRLGGAIYVGSNGSFYMYGGKIQNNTADGAGTVHVSESTVKLYGGSITGNTAASGAGVYATKSQVTLGGAPVVKGNTTAGNASNLYLRNGSAVTLENLAAGEKQIGIGAETFPCTVIEDMGQQDHSGYFFSDSQYRMLHTQGSKLLLTTSDDHKHCPCGSPEGNNCDHAAQVWVAWENPNALPASDGYYYLVTDVSVKDHTNFDAGHVRLCLNGHTVTAEGEEAAKSDRFYTLQKDASLTISDCTAQIKDGQYTAGKLTGATGSALMILNQTADGAVNNVKVHFYDGIFTGNAVTGSGGVICVQDQAVFNMYGGEISGNTGKISTAADGTVSGGTGAAFYVGTNATLNLYGGQIKHNHCEDSGTIYLTGGSMLNMLGGEISGNTAVNNAAAVMVAGKDTLATMQGGEISGNTARNGGAVVVQSRATFNMMKGSITGNKATASGGAVYVSTNSFFNLLGGSITGNQAVGGGGGVYQYGGAVTLQGGEISGNTAENGGGFYVRQNGDVFSTLEITGGKIRENKATAAGGGVFTNGKGTVLTLDGGEISGNEAVNGGGVLAQGDSLVALKSGKLSQNKAKNGGGAYISYTARLDQTGGEISGNTVTANGGGIYSLGSQQNLSGGKISGNSAKGTGGALYASKYTRFTGTPEEITYTSQIHLAGVTVSGNTTPGNGAGICTSHGAVVNMSAGSVTGNVAGKAGAGLLLQSKSKLNLSGGTISNNRAVNGAGVYISTDAFLNMTGGTVSYNSSTGHGAGMYLLRCQVTLAGGSVSHNATDATGGGLYMAGVKATLSGTAITENTAKSNGGGICTSRSVVSSTKTEYLTNITMTGGRIAGNDTTGSGGGMLLQSKTTMVLKNGIVEKNHTGKDGAGIYVSSNCLFTMEGGEVRYNAADRNGAGLYNYKSTNTYTGGAIHHNTANTNGGGIVMTGEGYVNSMSGNIQITENAAGNGGGLVVQGRVTLNMDQVTLKNNYASTGNGGAIYLSTNSFLNITGGSMEDHTAGGYGGAIFSTTNSYLTMTDTQVLRNKANFGGGFSLGGTTDIQNVTLAENEATEEGGGIYVHKMLVGGPGEHHQAVIRDSVIEHNKAGKQGGGLFLRRGSKSVLDGLTVRGNTAGAEGGGLYVIDDTSMYNMTVTGNTSGGAGYAFYMAPSEFDGHSYFIGTFKFGGQMQVTDNVGGDLYMGEQTCVAVDHMGLTGDTLMKIKLHSGYLTNTLYGEYDYEGGNGEYIVTAGSRSVTDPEYDAAYNNQFSDPTEAVTDATQPQQTGQDGGSGILYIVIGAFAAVAAAGIAVIAVMKKKAAKANKN